MDKSQVRSCISGSGSITYDPLTGIIGGGGGGTGTVTSIATAGLISGGTITTTGTITTAMATNKLVGRATAGTGVMEEITLGTGLSFTGTTLNATGGGLTVGTTPIASGTAGRVLFEGAGNVLQENAILNLDTTNGLIIGGTTARGTRLTAINAANTNASKTLVVRNAADSATMLELSGDGVLRVQSTAGYGGTISPYTAIDAFWLTGGTPAANADPTRAGIFMTTDTIGMYVGGGTTLRYALKFSSELANPAGTDWHLISGGSALSGSLYLASAAGTANSKFHFTANSHFNIGAIGISTNGSNLIKVLNGTAPTANSTNCMQIYSQNITNASFHVRDSNDRVFYAGENVGMRSNHDLKLAANNTVYVTVSTAGLVTLADASNIAVGTTTGTKIGTATTQKLSFWNKTPIVQPTTAITGATLVSNAGTTITSTDTFGGYTLQQIAAALINTGILQ